MKISTAAIKLFNHFGFETGLDILSQSGFEAVDFSIPHILPTDTHTTFDNATLAEKAKQFIKLARNSKLEIFQSHAAFPLKIFDPDADAALLDTAIRSVYTAAYLECPNLVFHPVLHPDFDNGNNAETAKLVNLEFFSALVPALKDTGVTVCIENMFRGENYKPKIYNACSGAEELADLVDSLNQAHGTHFDACLDTGHAMVVGQDPAAMLRTLGSRTRVLHIHDNDGILDQHWLPGIGVIDWDDVLKAIGEIGFTGVFNTEVSTVLAKCTQEGTYDVDNAIKVCSELYQHCRKIADRI